MKFPNGITHNSLLAAAEVRSGVCDGISEGSTHPVCLCGSMASLILWCPLFGYTQEQMAWTDGWMDGGKNRRHDHQSTLARTGPRIRWCEIYIRHLPAEPRSRGETLACLLSILTSTSSNIVMSLIRRIMEMGKRF